MSRRRGRRKHVPQRTCVACRSIAGKRELVRIVRTPEGAVVVDETGKLNGRGAYLCPQLSCWKAGLDRKALDQALNTRITAEAHARLMEYAAGLPQPLTAEAEHHQEAAKGVGQDE